MKPCGHILSITCAVLLSFTSAFAGDDPWSETVRSAPRPEAVELQLDQVNAIGKTSRECAEEARALTTSDFNKAEYTAMIARGPERDEGELGVAGHQAVQNAIGGVTSYMMIFDVAAGSETIGNNMRTVGCSIEPGLMTFVQSAREGNAVQMVESGHQFVVITVSLAHAVRGFAALQTAPNAIASNPRITSFVRSGFGTIAAKAQPQIALAAAVPMASANGLSSASKLAIHELFMAQPGGGDGIRRTTGGVASSSEGFTGGTFGSHMMIWGGVVPVGMFGGMFVLHESGLIDRFLEALPSKAMNAEQNDGGGTVKDGNKSGYFYRPASKRNNRKTAKAPGINGSGDDILR